MICQFCNEELDQEMLPEIHDIICSYKLIEASRNYINGLDIQQIVKKRIWNKQVQILKGIFKPKAWKKWSQTQLEDPQQNKEITDFVIEVKEEEIEKPIRKCLACKHVFQSRQVYQRHCKRFHKNYGTSKQPILLI